MGVSGLEGNAGSGAGPQDGAVPAGQPPLLEARHIHFAYRQRPVLCGVSLAVGPGEIVSLLGANGAGKSTLLRILLGLLNPSGGTVLAEGSPLRSRTRREIAKRLAYVPQVHSMPFPYTVREVVLMGRLPDRGVFRGASHCDTEVAASVLERLGIAHLSGRAYTEVSGGERQLTLVGRALAQEAGVLIMDEPMASLDFGYQVRLARHLCALAAEGRAILMSTHDPQFAMQTSTRTALLIAGRIEGDGRPRETLTPAAIQRLYGVEAESFVLPDGRAAIFPAATSSATLQALR